MIRLDPVARRAQSVFNVQNVPVLKRSSSSDKRLTHHDRNMQLEQP